MGDAAAATAAINQFKQSLPSAGPRKNAYGQQEVGLSGRQVKAEAKRQMYLQSTEPAPKLRLVGKLLEMHRKKHGLPKDWQPEDAEPAAAHRPQEGAAVEGAHRGKRRYGGSSSDEEHRHKRRKKKKKKKKRKKERKERKEKKRKRERSSSSS